MYVRTKKMNSKNISLRGPPYFKTYPYSFFGSTTTIYIYIYTQTHILILHIYICVCRISMYIYFFHTHSYIYVVSSISFQPFLYRRLIVIDTWKFSMLLLYILWDDWSIFMISGSNEQLQQELEYTLLKPDCHS